MKILPFLCVLFLAAACSNQQSQEQIDTGRADHSLTEELKIFHDITSLPSFQDSSFSGQVSSYDTTWNNDDGFSGKYSFIRRNADSSLVIFDVKGAGVIHRFWTPTPTEDTLDFFIDQEVHPTFSIKYSDLFSGSRYPFIAPLCGNQLGGFYCYLPIPFAKSCKVVSRGKKLQFHQIQYGLYGDSRKVKSFDTALTNDEKGLLDKIAAQWSKKEKSIADFYDDKPLESTTPININPGETKEIFSLHRGGRIVGMELSPASAFEGLSKNIVLKVTWDKEGKPAIFCPVADFFGYAFGEASMQSFLVGTSGDKSYCYLPMPFDGDAKIEVIYLNEGAEKQGIAFTARLWYTEQARVAAREGKFYAHWSKTDKSAKGKPHVFLDTKGRGHYVGTVLQAQGLKAGMTYFFEGDDSTAVDGSFNMHGTGSEDYFNGGWYALMDRWEGKMSLPLHGALDYSVPFCRTGGYRFFLSDRISYDTSFYHSIEHGPVRNEFPIDYTSVGFYYSDTPPSVITEPIPALTTVFLPDTLFIYPQLMDFNLFGDIDVKTTWKYGTGGQTYFFTPGDESALRISLEEIPHGRYALYFDVMEEPYGCSFSLWQRQSPVSDWISTYNANEVRKTDLYASDITIEDFKNTLTLQFKTEGEKQTFVLNRIILIKK